MAPSLEEAVSDLPIHTKSTNINGTKAISLLKLHETAQHDLVLKVFRAYIADLCQQFNGGHPG